jgi:hypothetical protein
MSAADVMVEPGQSWSIRDDRYDGWRYVRVESIERDHALVVPRSRNGRRSRIRLAAFRRSRFTLCGYDGLGLLPAYTGSLRNGCGNCPSRQRVLDLTTDLYVGFGMVTVTRDGERVWQGGIHEPRRASHTKRVAHMELRARETPGDWRIRFDRPLSEELYQRQPDGWVLVWRGMGFA